MAGLIPPRETPSPSSSRRKSYDIIFDAGNGIAKADRYISQEKPVLLFLSHFHIDHIAGLHTLVKFRLKKA